MPPHKMQVPASNCVDDLEFDVEDQWLFAETVEGS